MYIPFKELESAITHVDAWLQCWLYSYFLFVHSSLLSLYSDVDKLIKSYGVNELYFQLMITFKVSKQSNKISLLKRQHWQITHMSESTNIQGLSNSFENSNYSYPSHITCIAHLSPSSLCFPWSPSYYPSNDITVYLIITSHVLYQAICCSFILSMCRNHHSTLW